jgi:hypothetical protein
VFERARGSDTFASLPPPSASHLGTNNEESFRKKKADFYAICLNEVETKVLLSGQQKLHPEKKKVELTSAEMNCVGASECAVTYTGSFLAPKKLLFCHDR